MLLSESNLQSNQSQLYEDLSTIISLFKKILTLSESMILCLQNDSHAPGYIKSIKQLVISCGEVTKQYNFVVIDKSRNSTTFLRFISRLFESLISFKNKISKHILVGVYNNLLAEIENSIITYKNEKNIFLTFKKIYNYFQKFCQICEDYIENGQIKINLNSETNSKKQKQQKDLEQKQQGKKIIMSQTQTNFNKIIKSVNQRFSLYSCLGIEYNHFKTSYFQTRNDKTQLFEDYLNRNSNVSREINFYSKSFKDYLKRKERAALLRRNRFKETKQAKQLQNQYNFQKKKSRLNKLHKKYTMPEKIEENQNLVQEEDYKNFINKFQIQKSSETDQKQDISELSIPTLDYKNIELQKRKTSYQMNNVYLTLSKPLGKAVLNFDEKKTKERKDISALHQIHFKSIKSKYPKIEGNASIVSEGYSETISPFYQKEHSQTNKIKTKQYHSVLKRQEKRKVFMYDINEDEIKNVFIKNRQLKGSNKDVSEKKNIRITYLNSRPNNNPIKIVKAELKQQYNPQANCKLQSLNGASISFKPK